MGESCKSRSFKLTGYEREPASKQKTDKSSVQFQNGTLCCSFLSGLVDVNAKHTSSSFMMERIVRLGTFQPADGV